MARKTLTILLLSALPALGGCQGLAFLGYMFAPGDDDAKKVDAQYKGLDKHTLAIVIFADQKVQYEYPTAREHVAAAIAVRFADSEVRDEIKGLRVINPDAVANYQRQNLHWDDLDKTQLGKALGADYVLFVSLVEFTTREPASVNLLQGLVTAEVALYKTDLPERDARVYKGADVRVVYPKNLAGGVPGYNDSYIREETVKEFAKKVVWKFYDHKEPVEKT
jgi:hypothetical protein